jgi:hypothetical protein
VLFAGGVDLSRNFTAAVDVYDYAHSTWRPSAQLSAARALWDSGASAGDYALFGGGLVDGVRVFDTVDVVHLTTMRMTVATLSQARFQALSLAVADRWILFAGGTYDPRCARAVVPTPQSPDCAVLSSPPVRLSACPPCAGYAGISFFNFTCSAAVDVFDTTTGAWALLTMPVARTAFAGTALGSTPYVVFGGGYTNAWPVADSVDLLDLSAGRWSQPMRLAVWRSHFVAVASVSADATTATVYWGGGETSQAYCNVIEVFTIPLNPSSVAVAAPPPVQEDS